MPGSQGEVVHVDAPRYLYKYREMGPFVERLLLGGEVWFASRGSFNDPFECKPRISLDSSKQELRRYADHVFRNLPSTQRKAKVRDVVGSRAARAQSDFASVTRQLDQALDTRVGIFCLTAKHDNILMWSHYAKSHTGCCVQFDLGAGDPVLGQALPVHYQEKCPVVRPIVQNGFASFAPTFLTKSVHWSYEEEGRVVDLVRGQGARSLQPAAVSGIILGARMSEADETLIREWAAARIAPIRIARAQLGKYKYEVACADIEPITVEAEP